jgi:hypothetical protein
MLGWEKTNLVALGCNIAFALTSLAHADWAWAIISAVGVFCGLMGARPTHKDAQ